MSSSSLNKTIARVCGLSTLYISSLCLFISSAHAAADKEYEVEGLPQLDFSTYSAQIFWMLVLFSLLYLIFAGKTLPKISSTIENRKNHIDNNLKTAESLQQEAMDAKNAYEEQFSMAQKNAQQTVQDAENAAKDALQNALAQFQQRTVQDITHAEEEIEKAKNNILNDMDKIVAQSSDLATQKIIGSANNAGKKAA